MFHNIVHTVFGGNQGANARFERRQDAQRHLVFLGEFDRPDLQHLGAEAGHFQHPLEGDPVQPARFGLDARVGGVNAVHVGENLAFVRLQRGGERHPGGVRSTAAERGDVVPLVDALESGDHDDAPLLEVGLDVFVIYGADARLVIRGIGQDADLAAGIGARGVTALFQRHDQQCDRDLLAGRQQHVELAPARARIDLPREFDQAVGLAAHRRDHDDHVVALVAAGDHLFGDGLDALDRAHRRAAEFLHE